MQPEIRTTINKELPTQCRRAVPLIFNEQLYSSASDREKNKQKNNIQ